MYPPQLLEDDELGIFVHDHKITAKLFRDFDRDPDQLRACIAAQPQSVVTFYQPCMSSGVGTCKLLLLLPVHCVQGLFVAGPSSPISPRYRLWQKVSQSCRPLWLSTAHLVFPWPARVPPFTRIPQKRVEPGFNLPCTFAPFPCAPRTGFNLHCNPEVNPLPKVG